MTREAAHDGDAGACGGIRLPAGLRRALARMAGTGSKVDTPSRSEPVTTSNDPARSTERPHVLDGLAVVAWATFRFVLHHRRAVIGVGALGFVTGLLVAVVQGPQSNGGATRTAAANPDAEGAFPLHGAWIWRGGAPVLPTRGVGCADDHVKIVGTPTTIDLVRGKWKYGAFDIFEWSRHGDTAVIVIESAFRNGRRRLRVELDLSQPSQTHVSRIWEIRGRELVPVARADFARDRELSALREAFTLTRCDGPQVATVTLMRGTSANPADARDRIAAPPKESSFVIVGPPRSKPGLPSFSRWRLRD